MRLWHQFLIPYLPRQQLLGQHRELAALRGKGWGKKHKIVDYVFTHEHERLVAYHFLVMEEMRRRGYYPDPIWMNVNWRGSVLGEEENWANSSLVQDLCEASRIYPEHDDDYLQECLENLKGKGIDLYGVVG